MLRPLCLLSVRAINGWETAERDFFAPHEHKVPDVGDISASIPSVANSWWKDERASSGDVRHLCRSPTEHATKGREVAISP